MSSLVICLSGFSIPFWLGCPAASMQVLVFALCFLDAFRKVGPAFHPKLVGKLQVLQINANYSFDHWWHWCCQWLIASLILHFQRCRYRLPHVNSIQFACVNSTVFVALISRYLQFEWLLKALSVHRPVNSRCAASLDAAMLTKWIYCMWKTYVYISYIYYILYI